MKIGMEFGDASHPLLKSCRDIFRERQTKSVWITRLGEYGERVGGEGNI